MCAVLLSFPPLCHFPSGKRSTSPSVPLLSSPLRAPPRLLSCQHASGFHQARCTGEPEHRVYQQAEHHFDVAINIHSKFHIHSHPFMYDSSLASRNTPSMKMQQYLLTQCVSSSSGNSVCLVSISTCFFFTFRYQMCVLESPGSLLIFFLLTQVGFHSQS